MAAVLEATCDVLKVQEWRDRAVVLTRERFPLKPGESGLMRSEVYRVYVSRPLWGGVEVTTATFATERSAREAFKDPRRA